MELGVFFYFLHEFSLTPFAISQMLFQLCAPLWGATLLKLKINEERRGRRKSLFWSSRKELLASAKDFLKIHLIEGGHLLSFLL